MNLFDYRVPESGESFDTLLEQENIKIIRIVSSDQLETKTYCQQEDEWVILLEGSALLEIDGTKKKLGRGDSLFIPAQTPHQVLEADRGTLWLAVHIITRIRFGESFKDLP